MNEPKISVVIPFYNAEKYIRQCLISVLASKFQDYEVIVVDDCSTDNSVDEVKKILPYFDGCLKIFSTEKNSGGAGVPRNIGVKNAVGEYIVFVDSDDLILPDALGYFALLADMYEADVVYAEKHFHLNDDEPFNAANLTPVCNIAVEELIETPTLESNDLRERMRRDIAGEFFILPWGTCYRRKFLTENKIDFPQMKYAEDLTFCFKCLCLAKNFLRIPHITNVHRTLKSSIGKNIASSFGEGILPWLKVFTENISLMDEFMSGLEFFRTNPDYRLEVLKHYTDVHFKMIKKFVQEFPSHEVQKIFYDELQNPELNSAGKNLIAACLYTERAFT